MDNALEKILSELENKKNELLQVQSNKSSNGQHVPKTVLEEIMVEANGISQEDLEKMSKMPNYVDAEVLVDTEVVNYMKQLAAQDFIKTDRGKQVYENYLHQLKEAKKQLLVLNNKEKEEFEEFKRLKREGKL